MHLAFRSINPASITTSPRVMYMQISDIFVLEKCCNQRLDVFSVDNLRFDDEVLRVIGSY